MSGIIINPANQSAPQQSIALQTRKSTDIPNSQITNIAEKDIEQQMLKLKQKYWSITLRPNTISGIYNCHGMTFASRRTGINIIHWNILKEDNYIIIKDSPILPGDIVLYISESGEIEHSGMVLSVNDNKQLSSIFVLSKWGDGSEVIHGLYICPYELSNIQFLRCEK
jgi:hypothetical protein